ncbi:MULTISPECIES: head GIN domain-containing protein [unclassified Arcicella]|uniref:head GIN domain-containing protein n=1 Tax=unclassified Arcicella TaxID=2644986 RepID=UPI00285F898D|nr:MULTISPECIES: head GIN domain-containing protein [unclassified Arcicella]MDR6560395.1 hypothetical protein [Arcicella sp. BE51]MDR6809999.1 hypothetical protein [Arcicella sp. BE140]MDR6821348.1 hypothetical protein [Arcicella sp. BE139]
MKTSQKTLIIALTLFMLTSLSSCFIHIEDPLPAYREQQEFFYLKNFDQLKMGSAFHVNVSQGNHYGIQAIGDEEDLNDLDVYVRNGILYVEYINYRSRRYNMNINITMPTLRSVDFYGASNSYVEGFSVKNLTIYLSGASKLETDLDAQNLNFDVSGASQLIMKGYGEKIISSVSGASQVNNFNFITGEQTLDVSGASRVKVNAIRFLRVTASGASNVRYRGTPTLERSLSGGSSVERD